MTEQTAISEQLERVQRRSLRIGLGAAALLAVGFFVDSTQFYHSYLTAFMYVLGPAVAGLAIVMLHNMTGGAWGFAVKRILEAAARTLPLLALLFIPIAFGIHSLYHWSHAEEVAADPILQHKSAYLNTGFYLVRAAFYFAVWIGLSYAILKLSDRYDRTLSLAARRKTQILSGIGLGGYVLTMSFASFDWTMSLEPHWFSSLYGLQIVVGQGLTTLCLAAIMASVIARHEPFSRWLKESHFHDVGNLILAFVMLWAYLSFSQFLIIWSGNLPEETPWYLNRLGGGWQTIAFVLVIFHFAVPFMILLMRRNKQLFSRLSKLAVVILLFRYVDYFWLVAPARHHGEFHASWMDLVAPIALGGIWLSMFIRNLHGHPLVSLQDGKLLRELEEAKS